MARLPRLVVAGQAHHVIQRGTGRQLVFRSADDFSRMLEMLADVARKFDLAIHAYVLMGNHFHLLLTPADRSSLSAGMQALGRSYVRYFNDRNGRIGALWEGRFKATFIESERYLFTCMSYIDLNPVRAALAAHPSEYAWSSYGHNAGLRRDPIIKEHPLFWALGNTPFARQAAYREIVDAGISLVDQAGLTEATLKGWGFGTPSYLQSLAASLVRRTSPLKKGRPFKQAQSNSKQSVPI